jgi:hypothetical protein
MKLDPRTVRTLERILERELAGYKEYLKLLSEEQQQGVVKLRADRLAELTERRDQAINELTKLRDEREELIERLVPDGDQRLSVVVRELCTAADFKRLDRLITRVKAVLVEVEARSREFNQLINFSLGLVNGEISLLWSASRPVTRVYNSFGSVNEATQPSAPRVGSLLGEA